MPVAAVELPDLAPGKGRAPRSLKPSPAGAACLISETRDFRCFELSDMQTCAEHEESKAARERFAFGYKDDGFRRSSQLLLIISISISIFTIFPTFTSFL
jgi:hypothetical protein